MARSSPANALTRAVLDCLSLHGVIAWRNATTGVYDQARQRFRTFTGRKGVSDILGVLPATPGHPGGRLLAVEVKAGRDRLRPEQRAFMDDVNRMGGKAIVARSVDDVFALLTDLGLRDQT
jgi:hypothetical protein